MGFRRHLGAALLLAAALAGLPRAGTGEPGERPGVFLGGANGPRAKALALDSALEKGWHVAEAGRGHAVFETILDEPAGRGPPNALPPEQTLLRIRADFIQTPAGVNAYLYAEERWYRGTSKEWISDITADYRDHLAGALDSLRARWKGIAREPPSIVTVTPATAALTGSDPVPTAREHSASMPASANIAPSTAAEDTGAMPIPRDDAAAASRGVEVGTWAYEAEQLAAQHGCAVADTGAELHARDQFGEVHRVPCRGGGAILIRCDRERCSVGR
ncbi:MAG: hypothetical protein K9L70_08720 [Thiohalocapsa sp.]|nr:hypothetical protein [Thiohalocapsa sp.]